MSRGGLRPGAGRKPSRRQLLAPSRNVVPFVEAQQGHLSALPPKDLPADQRDFWQRYAVLAIEKRTLTIHTVGAFRLLCETDAEKRATKATIDAQGRTFVKVTVDGSGQEHQELKAHPLTSSYGRLAKAVEALMARFSLAPFGKPVEPVAKRPAENPWVEVVK